MKVRSKHNDTFTYMTTFFPLPIIVNRCNIQHIRIKRKTKNIRTITLFTRLPIQQTSLRNPTTSTRKHKQQHHRPNQFLQIRYQTKYFNQRLQKTIPKNKHIHKHNPTNPHTPNLPPPLPILQNQ